MGTRLNFPLRVELELCSADTHLEPDSGINCTKFSRNTRSVDSLAKHSKAHGGESSTFWDVGYARRKEQTVPTCC